ncbi:MAG TPA: hypothetical protein VGO32_06610 [Candidatus Limnocylindria bacterium]|nr:hypothetical protein [Candidatus Limnocylindria bacterium]
MSRPQVASRRMTLSLPAALAPFRWTIGATSGLFAATLLTSATGFVFWWIAAQGYSESAIGLAGAAVSAMLFLSQVAMLGYGTALAGILHREERPASLAVTATLAAGIAGLILGVGFAVLAPLLSSELQPLAAPLAIVIFALGVCVAALTSVLDQVLVAVNQRLMQLIRNVIFGVGRLPVLLAIAAVVLWPDGMGIYVAWVVGLMLSLAVIVVLVHNAQLTGDIRPLMWGRLRAMAPDALAHHVVNLSRSGSVWLLPLLVTIVLSSEENAAFYIAFLVSNLILLLGKEATFTLYIVGARAPETLWRQIRFTLGFCALASVLGTIVLSVLGPRVLGVFGSSYETAYPVLLILSISALPVLVKDHWIAVHRVRGSVSKAAVVGVITLAMELAGAVVGALWGEQLGFALLGFAIGRLVALLVQAAFMLPMLISVMRPPAGGTPVTPSATDADPTEAVFA